MENSPHLGQVALRKRKRIVARKGFIANRNISLLRRTQPQRLRPPPASL
jgi:hypothetical protein